MKIREFRQSDLDRVREIHKRCHASGFEFPDIERIISAAVIEDEHGRVAALGMIRPIAESIMILDLSMKPRAKVESLELLLGEADLQAYKAGFDQTHAFVQGSFSEILKNHFGFRDCKGQALVRDI